MRVSFDSIKVGSLWDRNDLASLWGYAGYQALGRGHVTPRGDNKIILFVTKEKREGISEYENTLDGDILKADGENNHGSDRRLISAAEAGDEIHLFYRELHRDLFTYHGQVDLLEHTIHSNGPSRFMFKLWPQK